MLTEDRTTRPTRPDLGSHWWSVTGLTGLASIGLGGFVGFVLAWDLDPTWVTETFFWVPLVLAGLITGYVGGLRRWWLVVPMVAAPLMWLGVVRGEGVVYPAVTGFGYWLLQVGTTTLVTLVATWLIRRFAD